MEVLMKSEDGLSRELDFGDVFGGPPRVIRGFRETARRPHLHGDDFFDDIFRGDESSYSCSPSPWRAHSHRFSFPAKLTKVVDFPTFSSRRDHVEYKSSMRFSEDRNGGRQDEITFEFYESPFSKEATLSSEDSPKLEKGDFAKIFNKETDLRPKSYVKMQSQSCRWTTAGIKHNQNDKVNENLRNVEAEVEYLQPQAKTPSNTRCNYLYYGTDSLESPRSDSHEMLGENSDDPFEDLFELQELQDDLESACEDTKADAKIRQWSAGKEGNIRSLLSTLQYVLWAGSEWKPIALVDLVEENPVKRAYQKALLQLHPDKLQQRGAALHTSTLHIKFSIFFRMHGTISIILLHCKEMDDIVPTQCRISIYLSLFYDHTKTN